MCVEFNTCVHCCAVNVGEDCPVFDGMYEFCQLSAGGSVGELYLAVNMMEDHRVLAYTCASVTYCART